MKISVHLHRYKRTLFLGTINKEAHPTREIYTLTQCDKKIERVATATHPIYEFKKYED